MRGVVTVGVDGSAPGLAAAACAAREAEVRGAVLHVVHAHSWPMAHASLDRVLSRAKRARLRETADRLLEDAVARACSAAPGVDVSARVVQGDPLTVLRAESGRADLVVVGSRGPAAPAGPWRGATAAGLAARGRCPVLVVPGPGDARGPVVLGVDGSPSGAEAVRFAFDEAARCGAPLLALHAWTTQSTSPATAAGPPPAAGSPAAGPGGGTAAEERLLAEAVAGRRERYPEVAVEARLVAGAPREALVEASRTARLTVVGSRGRTGFAGLRPGSVSAALLLRAHGPVAVVRGAPHDDRATGGARDASARQEARHGRAGPGTRAEESRASR
ncbi:universal stress protein [Streptomyces tropicalis]|uniref:Universal stress protein n=1 Tax=Streptomyces tropicalis TaxID=3034234 RepID=A0ABT6AA40_9ACTN|nr:universal stress protein [Streptomyces tropicalis]MDF3301509.1 universal stress protein [Streptomyces tropicalis]